MNIRGHTPYNKSSNQETNVHVTTRIIETLLQKIQAISTNKLEMKQHAVWGWTTFVYGLHDNFFHFLATNRLVLAMCLFIYRIRINVLVFTKHAIAAFMTYGNLSISSAVSFLMTLGSLPSDDPWRSWNSDCNVFIVWNQLSEGWRSPPRINLWIHVLVTGCVVSTWLNSGVTYNILKSLTKLLSSKWSDQISDVFGFKGSLRQQRTIHIFRNDIFRKAMEGDHSCIIDRGRHLTLPVVAAGNSTVCRRYRSITAVNFLHV
jgi:hypothetical protein